MTKARWKLEFNEMFMRKFPRTLRVPKTLIQERLTRTRNGSEDVKICSLSWPELKAIFGKGRKHTCLVVLILTFF
jgi:hypothetical protein